MAAVSPVEDILLGLKTFLSTNLDSYLAAIMAERADGLTLESVRRIEVTDEDPFGQTLYPFVAIAPISIDQEPLDMGHEQLTIVAEVLIVINEGTPANMLKKILRYAEAVREIIRDDPGMTAKVDQIRVTKTVHYAEDPDVPNLRAATITTEIIKDVAA
jgi:hypothetical protein